MFLVFFPIPPVFTDHVGVSIIPAPGSEVPGCEMTLECYIPKKAAVDVNGKVIFSNSGNAAHTFTAGTPSNGPSGEFDSGLVTSGGSFEWTPTTVGDFPYYCIVHPWMTGLITVNQTYTATIDIQPTDAEWTSGEEFPVILVDVDANRNSTVHEDLDLYNHDVDVIPSLRTGTPITLSSLTAAKLDNNPTTITIQNFSDRALLVTNSQADIIDKDDLTLEFGTWADVFDSTPINSTNFHGFALFNYDVRALTNYKHAYAVSSVDIEFPGIQTFTNKPLKGLILLSSSFGAVSPSNPLEVNFIINTNSTYTIPQGETLPIVADIFGFGFVNDGKEYNERIANQIIRLELEETGDNTGTFSGTLEYTMINQMNILNPKIYTSLSTISNKTSFIVMDDWDGDDSPRVYYDDLNEQGIRTPVYAEYATPTHTGIASFMISIGSVIINLEDMDLNIDADQIDIYTVVTTIGDANYDVVGNKTVANNGTSIALSNGDQLGRLLDITFDDYLWKTPASGPCATALANDGVTDTGLGKTNFTLIETTTSSGIFVGDFELPSLWCRPNAITPEPVTEQDIQVNYVDFRDAFGEIIDVKHGNGEKYELQLNSGLVTLPRGFQKTDIINSLSYGETNNYFFLQINHYLNSSELQKLQDDGITIVKPLNGFVYVATATTDQLNNFQNDSHSEIRSISPIKSEYKTDPKIIHNMVGEQLFTVFFHPLTSSNMTEIINKTDANIAEGIHAITASLSNNDFNNILNHSSVSFITYPEPQFEAEISTAKEVVSVIDNNNLPIHGLTGNGTIVLIFDVNQVYNHVDFIDRLTYINDTTDIVAEGRHATAVAGVLGGNGEINKGIAPKVKIFSYERQTNDSEWIGKEAASDLERGLKNAVEEAGIDKVDLMNISLGGAYHNNICEAFGSYTYTAMQLDSIVKGYNLPNEIFSEIIVTKSAGNYRDDIDICPGKTEFNTIITPATAKNPIVVGSIDSKDKVISSFSSFGPTNDNRIKPDLVAPGAYSSDANQGIQTIISNNDYGESSGTSIASPIVGGIIALMEEEWKRERESGFEKYVLPHTAKAILIHTATDLEPKGPDYKHGWGLVNASKAIELMKSAKYMNPRVNPNLEINPGQTIIFDGFNDLENKTYSLYESNYSDLKLTLVWDDVPAGPEATVPDAILINNLDLSLEIGDDEQKIRGWLLKPTVNDGLGIKNSVEPDIVNNVEMIQTTIGEVKQIKIVVERKSLSVLPQDFTLIVSAIPEHPIVDIKPLKKQQIDRGNKLEFTAEVISSDPSSTTFTLPGNLADARIDKNTGEFSWDVPSNQPKNTYEFTIKAENGESSDEENVDVEVGGCLIATAAFDSEMAPQVQYLREIRDNKLMNTQSGLSFMTGFNQFYYSFSPYVADYERENPAFKELVKIGITPMLSSLSILSLADSEMEIIAFGIGIILMNIGMYFVMPIYTIVKLKKHFQK